MIFASVATLGRVEYLNENYFAPDYFTYVVIDEFHHAVNEQYQRIVDYLSQNFYWDSPRLRREWTEKYL